MKERKKDNPDNQSRQTVSLQEILERFSVERTLKSTQTHTVKVHRKFRLCNAVMIVYK